MGAKVGPDSPVGAQSNSVGVAVAGATDMGRGNRLGRMVGMEITELGDGLAVERQGEGR